MTGLITFKEICELEPAILRAYRLAKMIGRRRGQPFCANAIWYEFFKPIVCHVIGDHRKPSPVYKIETATLEDLRMLGVGEIREPVFPEITIITSQSNDPRLKTARAYDVAYQTIYAALPDCKHDDRLCW